jgi:hypothetical protein
MALVFHARNAMLGTVCPAILSRCGLSIGLILLALTTHVGSRGDDP